MRPPRDVVVLATERQPRGLIRGQLIEEGAVIQVIDRANQPLRNVKSAWVKEQEAEVNDGKLVAGST